MTTRKMTTRDLTDFASSRAKSLAALFAKMKLGVVALLAGGLGSCVISDKPLIVGSKPFLGERFDAVLFEDFTDGAGYSSQKVGYRWMDGLYVRGSAPGKRMVKFAAEPLAGADLLIERTQDDAAAGQAKLFTYFIARKVADGAYLVVPLNENDLSPNERDGICGKDQPEGFCAIKDHDQLLTSARATAGKTLRNPSVAVLTFGDELKAASVPVAGAGK